MTVSGQVGPQAWVVQDGFYKEIIFRLKCASQERGCTCKYQRGAFLARGIVSEGSMRLGQLGGAGTREEPGVGF